MSFLHVNKRRGQEWKKNCCPFKCGLRPANINLGQKERKSGQCSMPKLLAKVQRDPLEDRFLLRAQS